MLDRYLLKEFIKYFLGALLLFSGVGMIAKVVESLKYIHGYTGSGMVIFEYYIYSLPQTVAIVVAPSFLFAICYVTSVMIQNKEFVTICMSGISQKRVFLSIVIFSLSFSVLFFGFNQFVVYPANLKAYEKSNNLKGLPLDAQSWRTVYDFHSKYRDYHFYMNAYLPREKKAFNVHISLMDDDQSLKKVIEAEEAYIVAGEWLLKKAMVISFENGSFKHLKRYAEKKEMIPVDGSYFRIFYLHKEVMNIFQLIEFIELKKERGQSAAIYASEYYWHLGFPLICFFFVLIGSVVALKIPKGSLATSLAISILCSIVYFLLMFYGRALGQAGILPPFIAGFLANSTVGAISLYCWFRYVD